MPQRSLDYETPAPASAKEKMGPLMLGALVLFIYPFCLLANVMSFAAPNDPSVSMLARIATKGFLWGSTVYPAVYLVAAGVSALLSSNDRPVGARRIAQVPLIYLGGLVFCFLVAFATGG